MGNESRNELTIIWRIENFSLWCQYPYGTCLVSPKCTVESFGKISFYLELYRKRKLPAERKFLLCDLISHNVTADGPIPTECTIEISNAGGETLQSETFLKSEVLSYPRYRKLQWKHFMKISELLDKMKNWSEDTLTIRCHILGESHTRQPRIECEARTKIGVDQCSFLWKVEMPNTSDWSESKNFFFPDATPMKVSLSAPEDDVLITIRREKGMRSLVFCRMSLLDKNGSERYSRSANYLFLDSPKTVCDFPPFFTKTILEDNEDTLLTNDGFTLTCNFLVRNQIDINEVRYRTLPRDSASCTVDAVSISDVPSLQDDLHGVFTCKKQAYVKLRVDNEIFHVHKSLLAARSKVFSAMFDQDMLVSQTGIIDIEDLEVKTVNSFLEFMYTGTLDDMDYKNASKLLMAAEKYQVVSLKEKCASFLISILSEENVCEVIPLANMVGHKLLKASTLDYIKSHAGNILRSPQWSQWIGNNVQLATEILCMLSTDIATGK